jgi:hypothetical protein
MRIVVEISRSEGFGRLADQRLPRVELLCEVFALAAELLDLFVEQLLEFCCGQHVLDVRKRSGRGVERFGRCILLVGRLVEVALGLDVSFGVGRERAAILARISRH